MQPVRLKPGQLVQSADDMDDATFIAHFNARHSDQLPGLEAMVENPGKDTIRVYRTFHNRIHDVLPMTMPHEHRGAWESE